MEVAVTTFGFAGFALIRPHLFGINGRDQRKREGFLHLWAVINHMLGVRDEFNICLLPMESAEIEFDIIMRNVLSPYIQVETPLFQQMLGALIDGLRDFLPLVEYESAMFMTRRAVGIPGYQYKVDMKLERPHRNIFTPEELASINAPLFQSPNILLLKVKDGRSINFIDTDPEALALAEQARVEFELPKSSYVKVREVPRNETEFMASLSAKKYNKLSRTAKVYVGMNLSMVSGLNNRATNYLIEMFLSHLVSNMRSQQQNRKSKK